MTDINDLIHPKWKFYTHSLKRRWETTDAAEMAKLKTAVAADMLACGVCDPNAFQPPHCFSYVYNGKGIVSQCASGGRYYDFTTDSMKGVAHCTCGQCWD